MEDEDMDETALRERLGNVQEERLTLANALHTILRESEEPEVMRVAMRALVGTDVGLHLLSVVDL